MVEIKSNHSKRNKITHRWVIWAQGGHQPLRALNHQKLHFVSITELSEQVVHSVHISQGKSFHPKEVSTSHLQPRVKTRLPQIWSTYWSQTLKTLWYTACVRTCVWAVPLWVIHIHSVNKLNATKHVCAATYHSTEWSGWIEQYFNQQQRRGQHCNLKWAEDFLMSLTVN